MASRTSR